MRNKLTRGLVTGTLGMVLALLIGSLGLIDTWEAKTWDWRVALMAEPGKATDDICLILLDQQSLDWAKEVNALTWPWPREIYGAVVNFCKRSGARAVAFDVLYTEPSKYGVDDDAAFTRSVSEFGHVALATFLSSHRGSHLKWPGTVPLPDFNIKDLDQWQKGPNPKIRSFSRSAMPIEELAQSVTVLCNVNLKPDPDGIFRKVDLVSFFNGNVLPSLGLGVYLAANPSAELFFGTHELSIGNRKIPVDNHGDALLRYRGPTGTHKTYSAAAVLQSEIQMLNGETPNINGIDAFKDKYVFFGFSAPGLYDLRPSPISGVYPGVEIYATFLDNFLSQDLMREVPGWMAVCLLFLLSLSCATAMTYLNNMAGSISAMAVFLSIPVLSGFGAYDRGFWLPMVVPQIAVVVTSGLALLANFASEGRQKRFIKKAFKHFLSPAVIDQLIKHPDRLKLGGERRALSIFFSDLQGFTSISENLDPESLIRLLNEYLTAMTDIIHEEGGTIDKYEGDAIIAFWNAPLEIPDHATRAVTAALRCQEKLARMRPEFRKRTGADMHMRIGINTGSAVVGNLGSHTRFDYTMIGDAVNLAARLEGANKQFGTFTMISQSTLDLTQGQFNMRELARLTVVGRNEPVTVYEPMTQKDYQGKKDMIDGFKRGLDLFYKGDIAAGEKVFSGIAAHDPAALAYAEKCQTLVGKVLEDWDGVWVMKTK